MNKLLIITALFASACATSESDDIQLEPARFADLQSKFGSLPDVKSSSIFQIKSDSQDKVVRVLEGSIDLLPTTELGLCESLPTLGACSLACDPTHAQQVVCKLTTGATLYVYEQKNFVGL